MDSIHFYSLARRLRKNFLAKPKNRQAKRKGGLVGIIQRKFGHRPKDTVYPRSSRFIGMGETLTR